MQNPAQQRVMLVGIGEPNNIGCFFREALDAAGIDYLFVDEWQYLGIARRSLAQRVRYRLTRRPSGYYRFNTELVSAFEAFKPDVVLVTKGPFVSVQALERMRSRAASVLVNYATDDPFNPLNRTRDLVRGIPYYDLYACPRRSLMEDVRRSGCQHVAYVPFGYHPRLHFREDQLTESERARFSCDVVFIGNADKDRLPFFRELVRDSRITLHLHGAGWDRHSQFARASRGFVFERDFRLALRCARIAVCLVRRANRDDNVMRTYETVACGAFMLAERTSGHVDLLREGEHMSCFGSPDELLAKVRRYVEADEVRERIARQGHSYMVGQPNTYADRLGEILKLASAVR